MTLRVGVIGSGFMGRTHAAAVRQCRGAELAGIAGGRQAPELAGEFGVPAFADPLEFLAAGPADAFVIASPHEFHHAQALAALRAGRHVLVDKPLATSAAHAREIVREAEGRGLALGLVYQQRRRRQNAEARRLLGEGAIGELTGIEGFMLSSTGLSKSWQRRAASVGWLLGYGVHQLDLFRWFTGAEPESLYALCASRPDERGPLEVETDSHLLLRFPGALPVSLWCSTVVPRPGVSFNGLHLVGERGIIEIAIGEGRLRLARDPERKWETLVQLDKISFGPQGMLKPARLEAYREIAQDFVDAALAGRQPAIGGRDGLAGVAIAEAACLSSRENRLVRFAAPDGLLAAQ